MFLQKSGTKFLLFGKCNHLQRGKKVKLLGGLSNSFSKWDLGTSGLH